MNQFLHFVLILIVVEDSLVPAKREKTALKLLIVLILIVVEDSLVRNDLNACAKYLEES